MTFRQLVTPSPLIRSKEYMGKTGYTNYDMYLPKGEGQKYAYGAEAAKVLEYNEAKHLKKLEVTEKKEFGEDNIDWKVSLLDSQHSRNFSLD